MTGELIGVTGATGAVGGRVAARLADRGLAQRLIVRDAGRAPQLDRAEVKVASGYDAADEMRAALEGVHTLFLVPAAEAEDRVQQHLTAVDAAIAAGVEHLVYLSFLNASAEATFTLARHHWETERAVRATGVPFTFLRMSLYLDFIPSMVLPEGIIRGPAGDGRVAAVLRDDIADVAAVVLTEEGHEGKTYDLTGRESISLAEAAAELSHLSGKSIRFEDETLEEAYTSRAGFGAPDWEVEGWVTSYVAIASGELDKVADTVLRLAGHEPVTLAEYVEAHPESLDHVEGG